MRVFILFHALLVLSAAQVIRQPVPTEGSFHIAYKQVKRYATTGFFFNISGADAAQHFHVYASCEERRKTGDQAEKHGCTLAMNGGPFSFKAPYCLGHVVSDGRVINNSPSGANIDFGVSSDGKHWVMGTLNSTSAGHGFLQLVTGFSFYVKQGHIVPADKPGEIAPRTMIGTDMKGNLMLFEVDGVERDKVGLTPRQAAQWFHDLGGYNVVNMDGGGSSTTFYQGKVIDYPTCIDYKIWCQRDVTSILCVK